MIDDKQSGNDELILVDHLLEIRTRMVVPLQEISVERYYYCCSGADPVACDVDGRRRQAEITNLSMIFWRTMCI